MVTTVAPNLTWPLGHRSFLSRYCDPHLYDADRYEPLEPWSFLTAYHTGELRPRRFFRGYIRTGREEKPTVTDAC